MDQESYPCNDQHHQYRQGVDEELEGEGNGADRNPFEILNIEY